LTDERVAAGGQSDSGALRKGRRAMAHLGRWWRLAGTGFCFAVYGAVGWLGGLIVLPLVALWPGSPRARERRIRAVVGLSFRALLALIAMLRLGDVEVHGREWLKHAGGKLIVANHPMYLDVVALVGLLPQASCIIKPAMRGHRLYRRFVAASGYIGGDAGWLDACVATLERGRALIVFPEGTRSIAGAGVRFRRGAAQVAVRSGCEVLPVMIHCEPRALGKGQSWYDVPDRPWRLTVRICPPQNLAALGWHDDMPHGVAARHVTRALEAFFDRRLQRGALPAPVPVRGAAQAEATACMPEDA
jgi:1-acyl-sn-glycerol-3-phosphate acyltransferase